LVTLPDTQWTSAGGNLTANQSFFKVTQPTISFFGSSNTTGINAAFEIAGSPVAGASVAAQTLSTALFVNAGAVGAATTTSYGAIIKAQTGATTNNITRFDGANTTLIVNEPGSTTSRLTASANFQLYAGSSATISLGTTISSAVTNRLVLSPTVSTFAQDAATSGAATVFQFKPSLSVGISI